MKRLFTIIIILFLLTILTACTQHDTISNEPDTVDLHDEGDYAHHEEDHEHDNTEIHASWLPDAITFSSVEDFLNAYVTASAGGDIDHLASEWGHFFGRTDVTSTYSAEDINFTSLENVHLPVDIPYGFELFTVTVSEGGVSFIFMRPEDVISEDAVLSALQNFRDVRFGFFRWDVDDSVLFDIMLEQNMSNDPLIDGKYLFRDLTWLGYYTVEWVSDRTRFWLQLPATPTNDRSATNELGGISLDDPHAMISFTETTTLNLQDTRAVETMIEELEAARR